MRKTIAGTELSRTIDEMPGVPSPLSRFFLEKIHVLEVCWSYAVDVGVIMKKLIFPLWMILFSTVLYADQIFLGDGTVLKGKIIQIGEHDVEFDPEGPVAFDVVDARSVVRIVYDDGKVVNNKLDILYRISGTVIKGVITRVSAEDVCIVPENGTEQKSVPRKEVARLEYGDGKIVYIIQKEFSADEGLSEGKRELRGFNDSWVRIGGFFSVSLLRGGILDRERRLFNIYRPDIMVAYLFPKDYHLDIMTMGGGGEVDIMPPAICFKQKKAFDFSGIKFALRARYGFQFADSAVIDKSVYYSSVEGYEQFRGRLMSHHYWSAGPVMNLVFSPRSNFFNFFINCYAMAGQIFNGQIKVGAALRSARQLPFELAGLYGAAGFVTAAAPGVIAVTRFLNRASYGGYTLRLGLGPHVSMNRHFPITFGLNIFYACSGITFRKAPLAYLDGRRKAVLHEIGAEISSGFHF